MAPPGMTRWPGGELTKPVIPREPKAVTPRVRCLTRAQALAVLKIHFSRPDALGPGPHLGLGSWGLPDTPTPKTGKVKFKIYLISKTGRGCASDQYGRHIPSKGYKKRGPNQQKGIRLGLQVNREPWITCAQKRNRCGDYQEGLHLGEIMVLTINKA